MGSTERNNNNPDLTTSLQEDQQIQKRQLGQRNDRSPAIKDIIFSVGLANTYKKGLLSCYYKRASAENKKTSQRKQKQRKQQRQEQNNHRRAPSKRLWTDCEHLY